MEKLADKGNGNYAYIDNILEANKIFVKEMGATLFTIAKDVKLQVEFNPALVKAYRLVGYENRLLANEDFNNDKKDAGELGAGHAVTAMYEIIPSGSDGPTETIDPLKYQQPNITKKGSNDNEIMTVKFRYKEPNEETSKLIVHTLKNDHKKLESASVNFRWSAAVAELGMLLRDSRFKGTSTYAEAIELARQSKGTDREGYRAEFIRLAETAELLAKGTTKEEALEK
jgi:Ca-activated chloride channel family protein